MKEEHKKGYKVLLNILKPIYILYYNPKMIGKDNIPKDESFIICSNHIHLFDQNNALISTKRMIHYMAKKEHLDGKFGWFFKTVGCIRVDREAHDNAAKEKVIDLLNNKYGVGIFPEGTRNILYKKEELNKKLFDLYKHKITYKKFIKILKNNQVKVSELNLLNKLLEEGRISQKDYIENSLNIKPYIKSLLRENKITNEEYRSSIMLPIKFGAVSLAQKTGAYIVPSAITGKYKFRSKNLKYTFGTPYKINEKMSLEDARKELQDKIIDLYLKENND